MNTLIVNGAQASNGQSHLLSCSGQLKIVLKKSIVLIIFTDILSSKMSTGCFSAITVEPIKLLVMFGVRCSEVKTDHYYLTRTVSVIRFYLDVLLI